jgi:diguanylate cyclase (GGDEF)-like protein
VSDRLARGGGLGLRSRMAIVIAAMSLAVLTILAWRLLELSRDVALRTQQEQGVALLQSMAPSLARAVAVNDLAGLDDQLYEAVLQVDPSWAEILYLEAYDATGQDLLRADTASALARRARAWPNGEFMACALQSDDACWQLAREPGEHSVLFVSVPASSGLRWGTVIGAFDVHGFEDSSQEWTQKGLAFIVVVAGLVFLAIWFSISRLVMQPLARLTQAARRMEEGDLSARAQLGRPDELGTLGDALDNMATRIQSHTAQLERKVAERSARIQMQKEELERVNANLASINTQLERLATTDALTGLHNRRYMKQSLEFELARGQRVEHPFCLLMIDIDHFKRVNDTWGHAVGDEVLVALAALLRDNLRNIDLRARWGGEEFVALLLDSDREAGLHTAEKLRATVEAMEIDVGLEEPVRITISVGLACFPKDGADEQGLFQHADAALYRAKEGGRNRVEG